MTGMMWALIGAAALAWSALTTMIMLNRKFVDCFIPFPGCRCEHCMRQAFGPVLLLSATASALAVAMIATPVYFAIM